MVYTVFYRSENGELSSEWVDADSYNIEDGIVTFYDEPDIGDAVLGDVDDPIAVYKDWVKIE